MMKQNVAAQLPQSPIITTHDTIMLYVTNC